MAKKREYDDDDGRTIADMSGVGRPGMVSFRRSTGDEDKPTPRHEDAGNGLGPFESRDERRMYILGALRAALLIAFAFILGLGLVTALLLLIWK